MTGSTSRPGRVDRRDFLQLGGVASAGAMWAGLTRQSGPGQGNGANAPDTFNEATIVQLQMMMAANRTSSAELTRVYLKRIEALDENGPRLNSVIEVNPDALDIAKPAARATSAAVRTVFWTCSSRVSRPPSRAVAA